MAILIGTDGNDTLTGADDVADDLTGGLGDDILIGGGGKGLDWAHYDNAPFAVTVNLQTGKASGGDGNDTLIEIEGVAGSSFNDTLTGDDENNSLNGGKGKDSLIGGLGNDTLMGGSGNDTLQGGEGYDYANYGVSPLAVIVNLATGTATGGDGTDTLTGMEGVFGSVYNDILIGDANTNSLEGGDGDDRLTGGGGDGDFLDGGFGNDFLDASGSEFSSLIGGDGNDFLMGSREGSDFMEGGLGNDVLIGDVGNGFDQAYYSNAPAAVLVNLVTGTASGGDGNDSLSGIEGVSGSFYNDIIIGNASDNDLVGWEGNDVLDGGNGNDTLRGDAGNDTLRGGAGSDFADYWSAFSAVTVNLATGTATGVDGDDTLSGIENVLGSVYSDTLIGDANGNFLLGYDGDDLLNGGMGADDLRGELGNDRYVVDNIGDSIHELALEGTDKVSSSVTFTLPKHVENLTLTGTSSINGNGNGAANTIIGNSAANRLNGGADNDVLRGGAGNDELNGGLGSDALTGGAGKDNFKFTVLDNGDSIGDFTVADDTFLLENSVFKALATTGTLAAGQFRTGTQALDANDFIIYDNVNGDLLYDADGNGVDTATVIANIGVGLNMTNADIVVV